MKVEQELDIQFHEQSWLLLIGKQPYQIAELTDPVPPKCFQRHLVPQQD